MSRKWMRGAAAMAAAAMSLACTAQVFAAVQGDVNGDGSCSVADAVVLMAYLSGDTNAKLTADADLDGDGRISAKDLTILKRGLIENEDPNPNPDPDPDPDPVAGDGYVTAVTFAANGVTLKNAAEETVSPDKAENITVDGTKVTITKPTDAGDVNVDGECANGQLCVDVDKEAYAEGQVTVNLRGLTLSNDSDSPIYVASVGDEFVLTVKNETVNTISDGKEYTNADGNSGAIYACDDMKIKGKGQLVVNGNATDGIVCKNDLKIWNGNIKVTAVDDGIRGKDSLRIGDPDSTDYTALNVDVKAGGDGLKSSSSKEGEGFVRISGGTVTIDAVADGIQAEQLFELRGGDVNIHTYEGSGYTGSGTTTGGNTGGWGGGPGGWGGGMQDGNSNKVTDSAKGVKAVGIYDEAGTTWQSGGDIVITGGTLTVDSSDDCVHCGGSMTITGGKLNLKSADDALHSDHDMTLGTKDGAYSDFEVYVTKCYEGVESQNIYQYSGTVVVKADDDGYNAAGGADGSGNANPGGWGGGPGGWGGGGGNYALTIAGGIAIVQSASGDHDAFDSNGSLTVSGGIVIANGNEPLDSDGTNTVSGGTVLTASQGSTIAAGTQFTIADSTGKVILSFKTMQAMGACTVKHSDGTVNMYTGGTITGGTDLITTDADNAQPLYADGTITGGTQVTASSGGGNTNPWSPFG